MNALSGLIAVGVVTVATILIGAYGLRVSRTTSDYYVASRSVGPWWNASAISGEYLSAASFLGVAGLILSFGADMLWFPVGYTAGYLIMLALVAAPLRRSGAYTLPDFAENRLESVAVRRVASLLVVGIGWLYLLPQLQGAGLTLNTLTNAPVWVGGVVVAVVVTLNLASGGMRSITFVQAFHYWLKLTAIAVPAILLIMVWQRDGAPLLDGDRPVTFSQQTMVTIRTPVRVQNTEAVQVTVRGRLDDKTYEGAKLELTAGAHDFGQDTTVVFPAGAAVPHVAPARSLTGDEWASPLSGGRDDHPLYVTYSLMVATFLGTMGLPHVLVRFYTNPTGRAARRTTLVVLGLLGVFYLFPLVFGALGRLYAPDLLMTGATDALVLVLPRRLIPGFGGELLGALVAGGAFAAFLSTSSGLAMSVAGVLSQDVFRGRGLRGFRLSAVLATVVPVGLALIGTDLPIASSVGLAFAVAASSFCPLLVLGIWWRGLTAAGAVAGLLTGGGLALLAVLATISGELRAGWFTTLLSWPAAWSVPLGFAVMIGVSLATRKRAPRSVNATMARLHAPEGTTGR
ncbi:sodium/solute symporter [Crossiella cryophila]|uniref:Na+(H+)/acetate symporter ActP n=1 Tax=Crossiella cryophila TaxID=43355 RepID=A0A7W7FYN9_9PSEU|nr:cation acetate symporter [Crossiella cryophila]MBB4681863.1 Na+(H+)/acetate symporter ActP [Crossiella cryophila]